MGDLQGDPRMWSTKMEEGNCRNCMCIWEGYPYKFHGNTSPFNYTPIQWHWIGGFHINEVDVFIWEVYETLKIYVQQKAHPDGCMDEGCVLNEAFFLLCEFLGKGCWYWEGGESVSSTI